MVIKLLLNCINEYKINTSYFGFGPLFLAGSPFFFNFIVSVEEVAPDKFLAFGLGLGFNFSARRLLTSSSAFSRSACEWKNVELTWLLAAILSKFELNAKADGPTVRLELVIKDRIRGWTNMCGFTFALSGCVISTGTSALVCSKTSTSTDWTSSWLSEMEDTRKSYCAEVMSSASSSQSSFSS